jgi:hypothetical protein
MEWRRERGIVAMAPTLARQRGPRWGSRITEETIRRRTLQRVPRTAIPLDVKTVVTHVFIQG